jgi:hypothetical protein
VASEIDARVVMRQDVHVQSLIPGGHDSNSFSAAQIGDAGGAAVKVFELRGRRHMEFVTMTVMIAASSSGRGPRGNTGAPFLVMVRRPHMKRDAAVSRVVVNAQHDSGDSVLGVSYNTPRNACRIYVTPNNRGVVRSVGFLHPLGSFGRLSDH